MIQKLEYETHRDGNGNVYGAIPSDTEIIAKINEVIDYINSRPEEGFASVNLGDEGDGLRAYESTKSVHVSYRDVKDLSQRLEVADSLPEEKPSEDLEEAAEQYTQEMLESWKFDSTGLRPIREPFIAGAEWQKKKDRETIELAEEHAILAGRVQMKEEMMKDAVEGKVFMSFAPGHNQMVMADVDLPINTKVKLIIIKED